ncbi:MAG: TraV family lipoprotein, partial [Desulfobulbaceae bacterium]|nr:TraV family lipoprotein [Desulfobulbaceae bacterium]
MNPLLIGLLILTVVAGCAPVKNAVNPYEENFRCRAKDSEGQCVDTPTAYRQARVPEAPSETTSAVQDEAQGERYRAISDLLAAPETPLLNPPKILRVLLLPYRGEANE